GAWLTERVWEATIVPALSDCGFRYATVDDYHFLCTGKSAAELEGYFTTEEDGRRLDLFPISEALRYRIPFTPAEDALAYLERLAESDKRTAAIYFDDIEKFGVWPETYDWVFGRGWLRKFIGGVLASGSIVPQTYREFHSNQRTRGIVYLPTTAYTEMNEWMLPAIAANAFADLVRREKERGAYETDKAFLRGGIWKNFLSRYPEANWMHKRMISLSQRLAELPEDAVGTRQAEEMRSLLYAAQANDAYWHGLFGGLYLPHLRRGAYRALVRLEALLDQAMARPARLRQDFDLDGRDELFLHNDKVQAIIKLDGRASICELDAYALEQNFGDTLRRHDEYYHRLILRGDTKAKQSAGIASAHDRIGFKHEISATDIQPDERARTLFADNLISSAGMAEPVCAYGLDDTPEESSAPEACFQARVGNMHILKRITLADNCVSVSYRFDAADTAGFQVELDIAMPSCDGVGGRYIHHGKILGSFGQSLELEDVNGITLDDQFMGGSVKLASSRPVRLLARPYFTVSRSEDGFERIMQSVWLTLSLPIVRGESDTTLTLEIQIARDDAASATQPEARIV
ncbi:MAG: alpha-amylase/4-alpha-glucanotransferase domain-containing protein, partial [Burkholderiales bacterium]